METIAKQLTLFRYVEGYGGHAQEPDELLLLLQLSRSFGVREALNVLGQNAIELLVRLQESSETTSHYLGWVTIDVDRVFLSFEKDRLRLTISNGTTVTEDEVTGAARIEKRLGEFRHFAIDPAVDSPRCLCPKYYPEFFK